MVRRPVQAKLKRQVSPIWAVIIIIAAVGLAFLIGLGGPLWRSLTAKKIPAGEIGRPGEIRTMQDLKRVAGERLGIVLSPLPDPKGGLPVAGVLPGTSNGLLVNDVIIEVEDAEVKGPKSMTDILRATLQVPVGQQVGVTIRRGGRTITVRVPRREATLAGGGMPGGGMSRDLRIDTRRMRGAR